MDERGKVIQEQCALDVFADHAAHTMHCLIAVIIVLATIVLACIAVILYQHDRRVALEHEYESYETYEYTIDQDAGDGGENNFVGRDLIYYGEPESDGQGD